MANNGPLPQVYLIRSIQMHEVVQESEHSDSAQALLESIY